MTIASDLPECFKDQQNVALFARHEGAFFLAEIFLNLTKTS